jgi:hypothetical protein
VAGARGEGRDLRVGPEVDLRAQAALLRRHAEGAGAHQRHRRARACSRCSATRSPPTTSRRPATSTRQPRRRSTSPSTASRADFNSYGARRGNHEVMMRGTFANIRLKNLLLGGVEGGVTKHIPSGERCIYDAAMKYQAEGTPLVILAGAEYGTGSIRDWAAKGTMLLGVRPSSRRASSASTARTSSAWACCRSSSSRPGRDDARPHRRRDVQHHRRRRGLAPGKKLTSSPRRATTASDDRRSPPQLRIDTPLQRARLLHCSTAASCPTWCAS